MPVTKKLTGAAKTAVEAKAKADVEAAEAEEAQAAADVVTSEAKEAQAKADVEAAEAAEAREASEAADEEVAKAEAHTVKYVIGVRSLITQKGIIAQGEPATVALFGNSQDTFDAHVKSKKIVEA